MQRQPGRIDYDQTLKRLLTQAHDGFLALIAPDVVWRGERSPELPAVPRQADLVWEVARHDGERGLLHVELQTTIADDVGERVAEYALRLWRRDHLPIRSVVVCLRETTRPPVSPFVIAWGAEETLRCRFAVVRLWEIPQERVLATPHYALWPLVSLMADVTVETTLAAAEQIAAAGLPRDERRELTGLLAVLASRRLTPAVVRELLRSNRMLEELLRESSLAELWKQEGREEGSHAGARAMAREALEGRFGALPVEVVAALERAGDETVRELVRHVSTEGMERVRSRLGLD